MLMISYDIKVMILYYDDDDDDDDDIIVMMMFSDSVLLFLLSLFRMKLFLWFRAYGIVIQI